MCGIMPLVHCADSSVSSSTTARSTLMLIQVWRSMASTSVPSWCSSAFTPCSAM
jgi:hypothetical protein